MWTVYVMESKLHKLKTRLKSFTRDVCTNTLPVLL
jgi:hypothetical protein